MGNDCDYEHEGMRRKRLHGRVNDSRVEGKTMKSAYELAMERLQKTAPSVSLTEEQKKQIAEVDANFRAKIAEREVFLKDQIAKARSGGKVEEVDELEKQLVSEVRRLQSDCEEKKEKLRTSFSA